MDQTSKFLSYLFQFHTKKTVAKYIRTFVCVIQSPPPPLPVARIWSSSQRAVVQPRRQEFHREGTLRNE
jgi:hypothetical protein